MIAAGARGRHKRKLRAPAVGTVSAAKMRRIEDALRVYVVL